jgi:hypothetical protein
MGNKMTKNEIIAEVQKFESKYFDLVWLARSSPKNDHIKGVVENRKRITELYSEEVKELLDEDAGEWNHGFNSGMLAGMRYVLGMAAYGKEDAEENFPFLDT